MTKKEKKEKVRCIDCYKGCLIQWDNNPVVVHCIHLECKDVASTPRECIHFIKNTEKPKINKMTHYR